MQLYFTPKNAAHLSHLNEDHGIQREESDSDESELAEASWTWALFLNPARDALLPLPAPLAPFHLGLWHNILLGLCGPVLLALLGFLDGHRGSLIRAGTVLGGKI